MFCGEISFPKKQTAIIIFVKNFISFYFIYAENIWIFLENFLIFFVFFVITKAQKGNKIQIQSVEKKYKGAMTTTINRHMEYFFGF